MSSESSSESVAQKLDKFFQNLNPSEQAVISEMVRESLLKAAERFVEEPIYYEERKVPDFVKGLTGEHAPNLIRSLGFPGSLAAHSIPGCNRSALAALGSVEKETREQ